MGVWPAWVVSDFSLRVFRFLRLILQRRNHKNTWEHDVLGVILVAEQETVKQKPDRVCDGPLADI